MTPEFIQRVLVTHRGCGHCPTQEEVAAFFDGLLGLLFPSYGREPIRDARSLEHRLIEKKNQLLVFLKAQGHPEKDRVAKDFLAFLPSYYDTLQKDVDAIFAGDPAAKSRDEVIRSYPGFYATAAYRLAHFLYQNRVEDLPRSITEYAHSKTGIDIHPGARIGEYFCIDHGTGVVIGETTEIGNHVKIYQGVTLGAKSVEKDQANKKRHPTIEDHVIIYSGATILGGRTVIGSHSVIGGNVWLTDSVPANSKIYYQTLIAEEIRQENKQSTES